MTIGEAIRYYEQLAENQIKCADRIDELHCDSTTTRYMAEHHRQLAEWLRELKRLREEQKDVYIKGYNKGHEDGYCEALEDSH